MRSRRPSAEHQEAVSRRLALLSAELAEARPVPDWYDDHTRVRPGPQARASSEPPVPVPVPVPVPGPASGAVPVEPRPGRGWPASPAPPGWPPDPPRPLPAPAPRQEPVGHGPPVVPLPGRHAARRRRPELSSRVGELVPETLRGRVAMGSAQLTVVSLVVALGLAVTCWWVVRADAGAPVAPAPVRTSPVADLVEVPAASASAVGVQEPAAEVVVDVAGRVRRPGIVVLEAGSRVVDAIDAAGGARPGVDLSTLNLARVLVDGEQVVVGAPPAAAPMTGVPGAAGPAGGAVGGGAVLPVLDLNTATAPQLETLPQVGPVTAAAIVAWRDQHGGFSTVEELLEVDGIGEATLAQLAPHVTVAGG